MTAFFVFSLENAPVKSSHARDEFLTLFLREAGDRDQRFVKERRQQLGHASYDVSIFSASTPMATLIFFGGIGWPVPLARGSFPSDNQSSYRVQTVE